MPGTLRSILLGTSGLAVALLAAAALAAARGLRDDPETRRRLASLAWLALVLQATHFLEELLTGFPRAFPAQFGLVAWPPLFFVAFNVACIAVWAAAARRMWLWPLWFLALGMIANGVAHPALALRTGGYFPGLYTSPVVGAAGIALLARLTSATATTPHRSAH